MQHICLAKALMLIREIELYDVSAERRATLKVSLEWMSLTPPRINAHCLHHQEQISENLDYLFGIALSADDEPSLRIMACHALCACMPHLSMMPFARWLVLTSAFRQLVDR